MSKKLLSIAVKGKTSVWGFNFYADPKHIPTWKADGLDIVEIENIVPEWIVRMGLTKPYVFIQDIWNLKNPFKSKAGKVQILDLDGGEE